MTFPERGCAGEQTRRAKLGDAIAAHRAGRLDEARTIYDGMLRLDRDDPDVLNFLGMLEFQRGDRQRGIELLRKSLQGAPRNAHALLNLGNMLAAVEGPEPALAMYERAIACDPELPEAWFNLGICQRRVRRFDEAAQSLDRAITLKPGYPAACEALGSLLYKLDRIAEAAEVYRRWCQLDPQNPLARHMLAATTGEGAPSRADDRYVAKLFDGFAASFDESLLALGYRAPQLIAAALGAHPRYQSRQLAILDAGCGTGLCGPLLRSSAGRLVGVDLSTAMIEQATARQVYDEVLTCELTSYLESHRAEFDVIVSADTLCYFGDLSGVTAAAANALHAGGHLLFTCEALPESRGDAFRLLPHGRYAHCGSYVQRILEAASFEVVAIEPVVLRKERGVDVAGWLATARRDI